MKVAFPALDGRGSRPPISPGIAPFWGKTGCSRSLGSKGDLPLVLWQDVNCGASCPSLSAKWVPHALPWRVIMGPAPCVLRMRFGAIFALLEQKDIEYMVC